MNKVWRRHFLTTLNDQQTYPQSHFLDLISKIIKSLKKKQQILFKLIENNISYSLDQSISSINKIDKMQLGIKYDKLLQQERIFLQNIQDFKSQDYYKTKAYVYTILVRINQICQASKQKYTLLKENIWINNFRNIKQEIMEDYNDLMHKNNYDILPLIRRFIKFQNQSISKFIPKKTNRSTSPIKITLQPIDKSFMYDRIKSAQSETSLKPTYSLQLPKKQKLLKKIIDEKKLTTEQIQINKIIQSKKSITKKSISRNKKQSQTFQKIYNKNFNKIYKILDVRDLQIQESFYFRMDMERQMKVRNQKIKQSIKEWDNLYQKNKNKIIVSNKKSQEQ